MSAEESSGVITRPPHLVLTDLYWVDYEKREQFLLELLLLTLLYETVLIQDEYLVLGKSVARWFHRQRAFDLLKPFLDSGVLKVLKFPRQAHRDPEHLAISENRPILARARQIEKYGSDGPYPFKPKEHQIEFYQRLDGYLLQDVKGAAQRFLTPEQNPIPGSNTRLKHVLANRDFLSVIEHRAFSAIDDSMADDYIRFLEHPEAAVERIKRRLGRDVGHHPFFNRSLGFRVGETYPPEKREAVQNLMHAVHAGVLCAKQNATGHYTQWLHEYPIVDIEEQATQHAEPDPAGTVRVDLVFKRDLRLPVIEERLNPKQMLAIADLFTTIRGSPEGIALRAAIRDLGADPQFQKQRECWSAVAENLTQAIVDHQLPSVVKTVTGNVVGGFLVGPLIGGLVREITSDPWFVTAGSVAGGALGAALSVEGARALMQEYRRRKAISSTLDEALEIRCTYVELPEVQDA